MDSPRVPGELVDFIKSGDKFIIAGHKEPDGDCVGSQLALCSALRRLGKEAAVYSAGPFKRSELNPYAGLFLSVPGESEKAGAKVIIIDCSTPERTGSLRQHIEGLPTAIIDHHAAGDHPSSTAQNPVYLDPASPSSTLLIFTLIEEMGMSLTAEEARLLFFGLCTDTGFFRHLDEKSAGAFEKAAEMIRAGANPKSVYLAMNGGKSLNSRILLGHILARAEIFFDGRLIFSYETLNDRQSLGLEARDSDNLYQLLQSIEGVQAIVIIRQESDDLCTVGFRSVDTIDVSAIAASFGGGGHRNAAGASIKGSVSDIKPKIIESFTKAFH